MRYDPVGSRLKIVILTIHPVIPPFSGTEKSIYATATKLAERKHEVVVVSVATGLKRIFSVVRIGAAVFVKIPLRSSLHELFAAIRFGVYETFPRFHFIVPWLYEKFLRAGGMDLWRVLEGIHCDVLICEDISVFETAAKIRSETGTPIVLRLHSIEAKSIVTEAPFASPPPSALIPFASEISRRIEERAIKGSNLVLTLSSDDNEIVRGLYGVDSECIGAGAETEEHQVDDTFVRRHGLGHGQYLLFVSSYLGGIDTVTRAAEALPKHCFVLVGRASTLDGASKTPDNIKLLGMVSESALEALYRYARAVLVPMSWAPGLGVPFKFVEALVHGKPVIVSLEVSKTLIGIEHLKNALVFRTFSELLEDIELIFNNHRLEEKLAIESKKYAMENLSWTVIIGNLEKFLKRLLRTLPQHHDE
jgi:glycosyltransferase involved in cell wall biosynthesis